MKKRGVIVALDLKSAPARKMVSRLGASVDFYKIPPALVMEDPGFIPWLLRRKKNIFLDAKWYDIPTQVQRSVTAAGREGITSCTLHTSAGSAVMRAALSARPRPLVWGVTVLTSLSGSELREVGLSSSPAQQVLRLARVAQKMGLDGLVCSPQEVKLLRRSGIRLPLITPGIQVGHLLGKDQKRTATPEEAWRAGANYLVIGRAVLDAPDPVTVVRSLLQLEKSL